MKVKAKKHLGQHFLKDLSIAENLANSLSGKNYNTIVEIGPGMGVLTQFLIPKNKPLTVIEIDTESVIYLQKKYPNQFEILEADVLKLDLTEKFKDNIALVGNFPYNISSQIMFQILEHKHIIPEMAGMFQKEVAERIAAKHGSKIYGILSVLIQAYYKVEYLYTIDEYVFDPPPKVKSAIIRLEKIRDELEVSEVLLKKIVKAGFNQRRKKLSNALKTLNIPVVLQGHNFLNLRAEQLSVDDFIELTRIWEHENQ